MFETMTNIMMRWNKRDEKQKEEKESKARVREEQKLDREVEIQKMHKAELARKEAIEEEILVKMVKSRRITFEMQRLKLKYFGDQSLENPTPVLVPPTYQGMSKDEATEAEEDFYYRWRFYHIVLTSEQCLVCLRILLKDKVGETDTRIAPKSQVTRKELLLDTAAQEETELEATRLMKGICLRVEEERAELKRKKVELKRNVAQLKIYLLKVGKWMETLKASQVVEINNLHAKVRTNFKEVVAERDRLGRHLMSKRYSEDEVDAIRADTYVEDEKNEEIEDVAIGIVDGSDGVSPQMVKDNQGDDSERPEG
ncbi:hypothetical protein GIB67_043034 [Kingdonia uniflora]|uniref:Uncharacterized protein n=1 Tax=Kingdonia uniflora TaxID=39325 RepID=A0A7J7NTP2_9MAGN|nr:hypothetical protein GIB67_043034 [Kingdonia uniflora]